MMKKLVFLMIGACLFLACGDDDLIVPGAPEFVKRYRCTRTYTGLIDTGQTGPIWVEDIDSVSISLGMLDGETPETFILTLPVEDQIGEETFNALVDDTSFEQTGVFPSMFNGRFIPVDSIYVQWFTGDNVGSYYNYYGKRDL